MTIVPTYRLIYFVGLIFLPLTLLMVMVSSIAVSTIFVAVAIIIAVAMDAYRSQGRLEGIRVMLPEVVRISKGREGNFNLQIENEKLKVRRLRLGLAFPEEIYTPAVEVSIELPEDNHISSIDWLLQGLKQGRYHLDKYYLETASLWGFWSIRTSVRINIEIRVYPNLFDERKNLSGLFLNKGLGIHAQRQVGKGRDFEQLREYLPGDSFEDIHWKTTAKRGVPITKVYQIERTQQIYVIIDASRLSARSPELNSLSGKGDEQIRADGLTTMLQRFITAALIMAMAAERQGDLFGLLTFDDKVRSFLKARMGKAHFNVCRDALYMLQPQSVSPDFTELFTFIGTKIRRRALLVFLTHLDDPILADSFTRYIDLISRHHVVLVNMIKPMVAKPLFTSESVSSINDIYNDLGGHMLWRRMRETQKVLQRRGVGFAMLDNENLCTELVSQYLTLKRRQVL
ncbi:MAG: DUF58 domain-containing protein [Desulfobacterales bacterium]|nr:DUF58 domain-containing protein [Desulfobacterales bacterium]